MGSAEDELSASYVNFYFVNGGLVIPRFGDDGDERDQQALQTAGAASEADHPAGLYQRYAADRWRAALRHSTGSCDGVSADHFFQLVQLVQLEFS